MSWTQLFLSNLDPVQRDALVQALGSGYQLCADAARGDVVPCITLLATYARVCLDTELVDDYELLIEHQRKAFQEYCHHPFLYIASCTCILHARGETPSAQSLTEIGLDEVFAELVDAED